MHHRLLALAVVSLVAAPLAAQESASAPAPVTRPDSAATLAAGRTYTEWFYADQGDSIIAHSSAQVKEKVTASQLSDIIGQLLSQAGPEVSVLSETVVPRDSLSAYMREAKFELMDEPLIVVFVLGGPNDIYGFRIFPKSQLPPELAQ
ncbi:MAG: hypothetical protein R2910_08610 [Gemmatimonadales bacterium]